MPMFIRSSMEEEKKATNSGIKCGRWNPTSEQVKVLMDLFGAGLRTPTTDQIHNISKELSLYGKIESKNVFYWFQNHKARHRHKRRRRKDINITNHSPPPPANPIQYLGEREIETLELFPMKESEKLSLLMFSRSECKQNHDHHPPFSCTNNNVDNCNYPPLDLRLSFF